MLNAKDTKARLEILNKLSISYLPINQKLAKFYNQQSLALAEKAGNIKGKADATYITFKIYKTSNQNEKALQAIRQAGALYLKCGELIPLADCMVDEGTILVKKQELKKAMQILLRARSIYESTGGHGQLALLYSNLGSLHHSQGNNAEAIRYHEKSLALNQARKFDLGISVNYINLGNVYNAWKKFTKAREYTQKALEIKLKIHDKRGIQKCLNNLGVICMNLGETSKAIDFHQKALNHAVDFKSDYDIAMCYINLGYDYQKARNNKQAISYTLKGLEIAAAIKDLMLQKEAGRVLSESYAAESNHPLAYKYLLLYKQFSDSLTKENNVKEIGEIQASYETVQKDNQIKALKINASAQEIRLQRIRGYVFFFIGLFLIVVALVIFLYQQSRNSRKIQAKLKEINDIKTAFFANLSHEFRTPLTLMLGPAEKLLETATEKDKPLLQLIYRNARRMLTIDEQLLEFTKIDSGAQKLKLTKGNIALLINSISGSFQLQANHNDITLECRIPDNLPDCYFDTDIIEKVLGNLISNAIKYTPKGGKVLVTLDTSSEINTKQSGNSIQSSNWLHIQVTDNGIGIPAEKQSIVFDRFYQVKNYNSEHPSGYGIGLALVKELVNLHKGHIKLISNPDDGSNFIVQLPLDSKVYSVEEMNETQPYRPADYTGHIFVKDQEDNQGVTEARKEQNNTFPQKSHSILIVDDNMDMRLYLREILADQYHVYEAKDGTEGLIAAQSKKPDVIVTDIMMEPMDGVEFCLNLKSDPVTKPIPVIMLTALSSTNQKIEGLETGAEDYITKPFHVNELLARIASLIRQRAYLKELFSNELKLEPAAITVASSESVFIQKLINVIEKHMSNPDFDMDMLSAAIGISRSQLHRKITALTGQSTTGFIKIIKVKRAAQLMEQKAGNISEIMYQVGFNNLSYFSKSFKEIYQVTPSEFVSGQQHNPS